MSILLDVLAVGAVDSTGAVLVSGQAYVYKVGTTTLATVYEDRECTIPVSNPVQLNSAGKAEVYALEEVRVLLEDADGVLVDDIASLGGLTSTDSLEDDITTLETQIETELEKEIGTVVNLGLTLSGGELKVTAQDGTTLSNTNYGRVWVPGSSGGLSASVKVTASAILRDDANANSDLTNLGFGITETAHWAEDVPFFLYVANRSNSNVDGVDGSSAFFISKSPCMSTTPASADDIGDTAAIPVNDSQDVILLIGDYTIANYVSLPCQVIGAFRMRWSTTTDDWTVQALGNKDGIGQTQLDKTFATEWTFPVGQMGAQSGKHFTVTDGGTALTFDPTNSVTYRLTKDGLCLVAFDFGTQSVAGADATAVRWFVPYVAVGTWYGSGLCQSAGSVFTSVQYIQTGLAYSFVAVSTDGALEDNDFSDTADYSKSTLLYKAFA